MIFRPVFFNVPTSNGNIYKRDNFDINEINEKAYKKTLLGELEPPRNNDVVTLANVSHVVRSVEFDKHGIVADVEILDTPQGKMVKALMKENVDVYLSARCIGVKDGNEIKDMKLLSFDFVGNDPYESIRKRMILNKKLKKVKNTKWLKTQA